MYNTATGGSLAAGPKASEGGTVPVQINLSGQVAVVTGAGSGIGRASALALARSGARVHAADIDRESAGRAVDEIRGRGGHGVAYALDVADAAAVEAFAASVFESEGAVDVLHNNAGIGHAANVEATTVEDWQRVISVNLLGVAYGVQAFVPRMLAQGRPASVVNTASMAGLVPSAKMAPYVASKYGVVGLTEALNAELSKRGIHFTRSARASSTPRSSRTGSCAATSSCCTAGPSSSTRAAAPRRRRSRTRCCAPSSTTV